MDEYISKQKVIDYLNGYLHSLDGADSLFDRGQRRALINAIHDISAIKAADVQPVKHGRWYHNTSKYISELDAYENDNYSKPLPSLTAQEALNELCDYFLGEDWYEPTGQTHPEIVNFAIVEEIERRYRGAKIKRNRRG